MTGGGGGGTSTTVQKSDPWSGVQPYLTQMYQDVSNIPDAEYYPDKTYVPRTGLEHTSDQMRMAQALGTMPGQIQQTQDAWGGLLGSMDVANNPYVNNMIDQQAQTVTDTLQNEWLPSINDSAMAAGQMGSSRHGVAQGEALGQASKALANAAAGTQLDAYGRGVEAQKYALGYAPQMLDLGMKPASVVDYVGQGQRQDQSQELSDQIARWNFNQSQPWDRANQTAQILQGGMNFGTQTSTGPNPYERSPMQDALGVGSLLMPFMLGACDMRLKENIRDRKTGLEVVKDLNVYDFNYKGADGDYVGVMAQEIMKTIPQAVVKHESGFLMVDYAQVVPYLIEAIKDLNIQVRSLQEAE